MIVTNPWPTVTLKKSEKVAPSIAEATNFGVSIGILILSAVVWNDLLAVWMDFGKENHRFSPDWASFADQKEPPNRSSCLILFAWRPMGFKSICDRLGRKTSPFPVVHCRFANRKVVLRSNAYITGAGESGNTKTALCGCRTEVRHRVHSILDVKPEAQFCCGLQRTCGEARNSCIFFLFLYVLLERLRQIFKFFPWLKHSACNP